tara:strand:+ start:66 stop:599 length:534 start_codon:yes stop_codon:yes gene_type:complete
MDYTKYLHLPILDIGNRVGQTDYIDFIKWDEVIHPVMRGRDIYSRHFIVIKMIIDNKKIMQTFFQRYTNGTKWMGCGHATSLLIDTSGNGLNHYQVLFLDELISNGKVLITDNSRPVNRKYINKEVYLFDEQKYNAILTLQKHWRLCRYNPKYKMCHKVQLKNLNDLKQEGLEKKLL